MEKWRWRWLIKANNFWSRIVASINGGDSGSLWFGSRPQRWSMWSDICKASGEVESLGPTFLNPFRKEVRSGINTRFWEDEWIQGAAER